MGGAKQKAPDRGTNYAIGKDGTAYVTKRDATGKHVGWDKVGHIDHIATEYYAHTQATLAHRGVKEQQLYRGTAQTASVGNLVATKPVSSWTHSLGIASSFGGKTVLVRDMPAHEMFMHDAHSPYGAGLSNSENEVVCFGKNVEVVAHEGGKKYRVK